MQTSNKLGFPLLLGAMWFFMVVATLVGSAELVGSTRSIAPAPSVSVSRNVAQPQGFAGPRLPRNAVR